MKKITGGFLVLPVLAVAIACQPSQPSTSPSNSNPVLTSPAPAHVTPKPAPTVQHSTPKPTPKVQHSATPPAKAILAACHFRYENGFTLPDPKCTPGSVQSSDVKAICTPGWSTAHREYFSKAEREAAFAEYGVHTVNPAGYGEYDHLIPLELGGSNSPANLWPEKGGIPNAKDPIENALHDAVCAGRVKLATAQHDIAQDWVTAGTKDIEVGSGLKATTAPPRPVSAPAATSAVGGYHWRQQSNGLRCVDAEGRFAKKSLCGG